MKPNKGKSLPQRLKQRIVNRDSFEDFVTNTAVEVVKAFNIDRNINADNKEYLEIEGEMVAQAEFLVRALAEKLGTLEASYSHRKENAEIQDAVQKREANLMTPLLNYEVFLEGDPDTSAALLSRVKKKVFLAGLNQQSEDRIAEIKGWINET